MGRNAAALPTDGTVTAPLATHRVDPSQSLQAIQVDPTTSQAQHFRLAVSGGSIKVEWVAIQHEGESEPGGRMMIGATLPAGTASSWLPDTSYESISQILIKLDEQRPMVGQPVITVQAAIPPRRTRRRYYGRRSGGRRSSRSYRSQPAMPESPGATSRVITKRGSAPANCIAASQCTPVPVFFGTNRTRDATADADEVKFTAGRGEDLILGRATVTVPRAYRKKGEIPRPSWSDLLSLRNPWTEDPARHFTILQDRTEIYEVPEAFIADVLKAAAEAGDYKDHAFVFVHGFNVTFEDALYRTAQITYDLGKDDVPFGTAFVYSWPSAGGVEAYVSDADSSRLAKPYFKRFLELVLRRSGVRKVHLIAHSMGNTVLLPVLAELIGDESLRGTIGQIILAAPDVDAGEFKSLAQSITSKLPPASRLLTLYSSSSDLAMIASRRAHNGLPRAGDLIDGHPVIVKGLDSIDISAISSAIFSLKHSLYADKAQLLNDMRLLMHKSLRPPDQRQNSLKPVATQEGTFWRFVE
ncbi:MAG: alpha/beta hydrolase [Hyphomicrobiaceae bacterium]